MNILRKKFKEEIAGVLMKELERTNVLAVPRMEKIVINIGLKDALRDSKLADDAAALVARISGQRPVVTRAKRAIAGFKLRQGDPIGVMVTLRGERMYDFFERLIRMVLPRVRDFHGVSTAAFDGRGNYSLGFPEITVFPEIETSEVKIQPGLQMTFVTTGQTKDQTKRLLELLGMPFKKVRSEPSKASLADGAGS